MSFGINFFVNERFRDIVPEPQPATKVFPQWFGEMSAIKQSKCPFSWVQGKNNPYQVIPTKYLSDKSNISKCPGIIDFLRQGYIIPAWDDFLFRENNGQLVINHTDFSYKTSVGLHFSHQFPDLPNPPMYGTFNNVECPWTIKTDPGISCLIMDPVWHRDKSFTSASGIFHTDQSPLRLKWFFEWNYKIKTGMEIENIDYKNQVVKRGDPLMLVIPFYRKEYQYKVNYVSETELDRLQHLQHISSHSLMEESPYSKFRRTLGRLFR